MAERQAELRCLTATAAHRVCASSCRGLLLAGMWACSVAPFAWGDCTCWWMVQTVAATNLCCGAGVGKKKTLNAGRSGGTAGLDDYQFNEALDDDTDFM